MSDTLAVVDEPEGQDATIALDASDVYDRLVRLELYYRERQLLRDPALKSLTIGAASSSVEHTLDGDPRSPYNGVAIFNPTSATLSVGFQAETAYLAPITVPPYSFIALPERYVNLSVALLNPADQAQTYTSKVTVLRLLVPPVPNAGPYGDPAAEPALAAVNPGATITVGPGGVAEIVAPNPARRELTIVNAGATGWVTLGLSAAIPAAMGAGIPLAPNGGAYTTSQYDGPISAIAASTGTVLSIAEA